MFAAPGPQTQENLLSPEYRASLDRTAEYFERYIALLVILGGTLAALTLIAAHLLGANVPLWILGVIALLVGWYATTYALIRNGRYSSRLRWISTVFDTSVPTLLMVVDLLSVGPQFSLAGSGPSLYPVAVLLAVLRLDWRLALLAGVLGALQQMGVLLFLLRPAVPVELHHTVGLEHFTAIAKSIQLVLAGLFGMLASRALQSLFLRVSRDAIERNRVRNLFGMHVSEEVMKTLLSGKAREGGELREATICFTDIRDFTSFCERRAPEEIVRFLNGYFERMCAIAARHGGVVNKFMGDGMLILFGAPNALENDAASAWAAAREMLEEADRMRESGQFPGLRIGIGLHRGEVVAATLGGKQRQEYTVIGDVVNAASRVQSLTREMNQPLLVTEQVRARLAGERLVSLGQARVKGKESSLALFAPADAPERHAATR